jgi:hypothetical protein
VTNRKEVKRAYGRLAAIKGFYWHLSAFVLVLTGLLIINVMTLTDGEWWVQWVFFGWGIGVLAHAIAIFARKPQFVDRWEKEKVRRLTER